MLTRRPAVLILAGLLLSAAPAFAQVAPSKPSRSETLLLPVPEEPKPKVDLSPEDKACQAAVGTFRKAIVAASKLATNPPAALKARAGLAPTEASTRKTCTGRPIALQLIDTTKEDLDISLGNAVPACKAAIDNARPHMAAAQQVLQTHDVATALKVHDLLAAARKGVATPCKAYPGVAGRLLRAENDMIAIGGAN